LGKNVLWLDTREPAEVENEPWSAVKSGQVLSIPLNELRGRIHELDSGKKIMLICKRGPRAYQAAIILKHAGFDDVHVIGGGYQASQV
jgi:rhodanese-related sulfurtransferase